MADDRISVEEVVSLLTRRRARLPFEIGSFVALEACEKLIDRGPAPVTPADVQVDDEGQVHVTATPNTASSGEAAQSVARVLARLLVAAGHGVPPGLLGLVEHGPEGGDWNLVRLRDELEASLVPLNRSAARRVMARVLRELRRGSPVTRSSAPPPPTPGRDVNAELDQFLGDGPGPEPGAFDEELPTRRVEVDALRNVREDATTREQPVGRPEPPAEPGEGVGGRGQPGIEAPSTFDRVAQAASPRTLEPERPVEPGPARVQGPTARRMPQAPELADLEAEQDEEHGWRRKGVIAVAGTLLALALVAVLVGSGWFGSDSAEGAGGTTGPGAADGLLQPDPSAAEPERGSADGEVIVHVVPENAEVLHFVGRGPATARGVPLGVAQEFVAIADGRSPTRAVVPADAAWSREASETPRYELAMQTGDEPMAFDEIRLGESRLPEDRGSPAGELGSIRVITNPPGAKVYRVVGAGPTVRLGDADPTDAHELLVVAAGHAPERVVVGPSDWTRAADGSHTAELTVELRR